MPRPIIVVLAVTLWLSLGVLVLWYLDPDLKKQSFALMVFLVPLGIVGDWYAQKKVDRWLEKKFFSDLSPNFGRCPDCGESLPMVRIPKTFRQGFWGGATCKKCGCEVDRRGYKIEK